MSLIVALLTIGGFILVQQARAETTSGAQQHGQSEFNLDVEAGIQQIHNDKDAQNNQHEIDNEDKENAGDEHGDVNEVNGENNQHEIDIEIDREVQQEDARDQSSGIHVNVNASTSIDTGDTGIQLNGNLEN